MKITAMILGILAGLVGAMHGVLEMLQGNAATPGLLINANQGGQSPMPALSVIPNFLITGILALLVSVVLMFWVMRQLQKKNGVPVLLGLSLLLLLVGGGFIPPVLGTAAVMISAFGIKKA